MKVRLEHFGLDVLRSRETWPDVTAGDILFQMRRDGLYRKVLDKRRRAMYSKYDYTFRENRPDYDLFRSAAPPRHCPPGRLAKATPFEIFRQGLTSDSSLVVWGTIGSFLRLHYRKSGRPFTEAETAQALQALTTTLLSGRALAPLPGSEASCHLVEAMVLDVIWTDKESDGEELALYPIEQYVRRIEFLLRQIDPRWRPGKALSLRTIHLERTAGRSVAPFDSWQLYHRVTRAMARVERIRPRPMYEYTSRVRASFKLSFYFALSAWKTTRFQRMRDLERSRLGLKSRHSEKQWCLQESKALYAAVNAALNAGNPLVSAGLAHCLLRCAIDELKDHKFFRSTANATASLIRQAAYEVDERYATTDSDRKGSQVIRYKSTAIHPWQLWIDYDVRCSHRWKAILAQYPTWSTVFPQLYDGVQPRVDPRDYDPRFLLGSIVFGSELSSFPSPTVLLPAFQLCLRYGFLSWAGKLLTRMRVSTHDLINFAHAMKRSLQVMPYGWHLEEQDQRRLNLRAAWDRWMTRSGQNRMRSWEALVMHEVLLGRVLSVMRHSGNDDTQLLIEKLSGFSSPRVIRQTFRKRLGVDRRGLGTTDKASFDRFLNDVSQRSALGQPLCISLASIGNGGWSLLAAAGNGHWRHRFERFPKLAATAAKLRRSSHLWHRRDVGNREYDICWGRDFVDLANTMAKLGKEMLPKSRWVMLAVEPALAGLPWQHLLPGHWRNDLIVSLVPSFSWATRAYERRLTHPPGPKLVVADDRELIEAIRNSGDAASFLDLRSTITRDAYGIRERIPSMAIVLGHGKRDPSSGMTLVAANGYVIPIASRSHENWFDLGQYRVLVVHSCFAGDVREHYLGDMGGLPGITLGLKSRMHCAPVTQVAPGVAATLHRHLIQDTVYSSFGDRYLSAIREEPRVALYNLFGFADELLS